MAGKNDNFDALMAMMALKHIMDDTKDIEIHPFTCEVVVTPTSISCSSSGNKAFLEDIDGGMEWAEETNNLIKDIMSEQTIKLTDLMKKKFGFDAERRNVCTIYRRTQLVRYAVENWNPYMVIDLDIYKEIRDGKRLDRKRQEY